jgi:hypothetical protein
VGAVVAFVVAAVAGVVGNQLTGEFGWVLVMFVGLLVVGGVVTYWLERGPGLGSAGSDAGPGGRGESAVQGGRLEADQRLAAAAVAQRPPQKPPNLIRAADGLACAVTKQWREETRLRGLHWPVPLQLTWKSTDLPVDPPPDSVADPKITGRVQRLRWHGHLGEIAEKFYALPRRRVVVLGEPGGGKTVLALLLTLELVKRRRPDDPVPVLLRLSTWDPTKMHLDSWLAAQLGEDYPALVSGEYGQDVPKQLIENELILPILDGLDELPESLRAAAIAELAQIRPEAPLVLTSRSQEYENAIAASGTLAHAAVVELESVETTEAIRYLQAATAPPADRWKQVANHLHAAPTGALAAALSTPLMVTLARPIYTSRDRDPSELVGIAQNGGQAAVERHLLDALIPTAYTTRPPAPGAPARRPPDPEQARRWLTLLATHLHQSNTRDLCWWQLPSLIPQRTMRLVIGPLYCSRGFTLSCRLCQ